MSDDTIVVQGDVQLIKARNGDTIRRPLNFPFIPEKDWLVLEMENPDDRTSSGRLYVPDTAKDAPQVGFVWATGPGIFAMNEAGEAYCTSPMLIQVGDRVLFAKYAGAEITWKDGQKYLFVQQSDIISRVL